jgi:hypothetical protein
MPEEYETQLTPESRSKKIEDIQKQIDELIEEREKLKRGEG